MMVYKVTNRMNGKIYIGATIRSLEKRKQAHIYGANSYWGALGKFHQAIKKYGIKYFKWQVICLCPDMDSLINQEGYYISHFDSKLNGYNRFTPHYINFSDPIIKNIEKFGKTLTPPLSVRNIMSKTWVDRSELSQLGKNKYHFSSKKKIRISEILGVKIEDLFD